jgi:hypothetical protein
VTLNGHRPAVRTAAATVTLNGATVANPRHRDMRKAWDASAKSRAQSAAERLATEKFVPIVDLLSPATVAKLAELLIARCVGTLDAATLLDLTEQLLDECERRGLTVPDLMEDEQR